MPKKMLNRPADEPDSDRSSECEVSTTTNDNGMELNASEESAEIPEIAEIAETEELVPSTSAGGGTSHKKKNKKRKKGIVYVSNIPKHMNVTRIREILGQYGDIDRVYLQPTKPADNAPDSKKKKHRKHAGKHFTEGWLEFNSKRTAKKLAARLNNTQIGTRKKSKFYDSLWNLKYLPRFKWIHLTERMSYEQAVHKQKLLAEVSQARREANFFSSNLDKSEMLKKKEQKLNKNNDS